MTGPQTLAVRHTADRKVASRAAVTYSSRETCPPKCAHFGTDCYAEGGRVGMLWPAITAGRRGTTFLRACAQLAAWHPDYWRHNIAGDLPIDETGRIDTAALALLDQTATYVRHSSWTYTHHVLQSAENQRIVKTAKHLTINASADTVKQARAYIRAGLPTVIATGEAVPRTIAGKPGITCPADLTSGRGTKSVTCTGGSFKDKDGHHACSVACGAGNPLCARRGKQRNFFIRFKLK